MQTEKHAVFSLTYQGVLVMMLPMVLKLLGIKVSSAESTMLLQALQVLIDQGATITGAIMAIIGRHRAASQLYWLPK
jgi:hypothetical protein